MGVVDALHEAVGAGYPDDPSTQVLCRAKVSIICTCITLLTLIPFTFFELRRDLQNLIFQLVFVFLEIPWLVLNIFNMTFNYVQDHKNLR